jgi:hypothetical protein
VNYTRNESFGYTTPSLPTVLRIAVYDQLIVTFELTQLFRSALYSTHASSSSSSLVLSSMHSTVIPALSAPSCLGASSIGSTLTLTRDVLFWSRLVHTLPLLVRAFLITVSGHRFTVILLAEICSSSPAS